MGRRRPRWHFTGLGCRLWCLIQLLVTASRASAQPGTEFISIDCGAPPVPEYQDDAGLTWQPDGDTVLPNLAATSAGSVQVARAAGLVRSMTTLRYFPPQSTPVKSCFVLPVTAGNLYLVRAGFFYGNYDALGSPSIEFQIALESTVWQDVALNGSSSTRPLYIEAVTPSLESSEINVCLIRTQATSTPFINTLELRPLDGFMYQSAQPALNQDFSRNVNFYLVQRVNFGERYRTLRYPDDLFDRIWPSYLDIYPELNTVVQNISTSRMIIDDLTRDEPPSAVMQTAITASEFSYSYPKGMAPGEYSMYMFYAELEELKPSQSRVFEVFPTYYDAGAHDDVNLSSLRPPFSTLQFGNTARTLGNASVTTRLSRNNTSDKGPILNADELYHVVDFENGTASSDVLNLHRLKELLGIPQWTGDPCMPVPWDELQCTNRTVTSLNLSRKNLSVPVPADRITGLGSVTSIDLSSNAFSGPFPNLSALSSLQALNISNNRLTGAFPDWVSELKSLSVLDVSNNNLTGSFPDTLLTLGNNFRYSGNLLLTCSGAACPYAPPPGFSPPSPASSRKAPAPSSSSALIGAIIGGIAGAGLLILVVTGIIVCCCKRQKINKRVPSTGLGDGAVSSEPVSPEPLKLPVRPGKAQPYTLQSLKEATNNFSKQISVGGFGSVFFGTLPDNQQIAVKKLLGSSQQSLRGFTTEIDFLSTVHHKNLVPLLGYCRESSALFLLYEYMAGGDLRRRLYGPNATSDPLSWKARLSIAVDAARGIEYLHHGCKPSIIHRGLTSSSILLTSKLDAKVSDFGLSKLIGDGKSQLTTALLGDTEYLDPEYSETRVLTEKSDVYSFGIILLEIMCGQPPVPPEGARLASSQGPLADRVQSAMNGGSLGRIMDPFMSGRYSSESASKFAEVAMSCLRASGSRRPTASQIITGLLQASEIENQVSEANRYSAAPVGHSRQSRARLPLPEYPSSTSNTDYLAEDMPSQIFHASEQPAPR